VTNMAFMLYGANAMTYPRPPVDTSEEEEEAKPCGEQHRERCCVCTVRCVDTICLPCGHLCMCRHCATIVLNKDKKCPICRKQIELLKPVFYAGLEAEEEE